MHGRVWDRGHVMFVGTTFLSSILQLEWWPVSQVASMIAIMGSDKATHSHGVQLRWWLCFQEPVHRK